MKRSKDEANSSILHSRRKLLKGGIYLAAAPYILALQGCNDDLSGTGEDGIFSKIAEARPDDLANEVVSETLVEPSLNTNLPPYGTHQPLPDQLKALVDELDKVANTPMNAQPPVNEAKEPEILDSAKEQVQLDPAETDEVNEAIEQVEQSRPQQRKMKVGIYNLETETFYVDNTRRTFDERTADSLAVTSSDGTTTHYEPAVVFLRRMLANKFAMAYRGMVLAFAKNHPKKNDANFFTLPEFYWNSPWSNFQNLAEINVVADIYLNLVREYSRKLISFFPEEEFGQVVLLSGTVAVLKPAEWFRKSDGSYFGGDEIVYGASNFLYCTHNLSTNDPQYPRPAYMVWPKRVVSWIDFTESSSGCSPRGVGDALGVDVTDLSNFAYKCTLNTQRKINVSISHLSSAVGQSFDANDKLLSTSFDNDIIPNLPFGIDICLDYSQANSINNERRASQLDERKYCLDFLIAAGMDLAEWTYSDVPNVQYAIHNEGINSYSEVWQLKHFNGAVSKFDMFPEPPTTLQSSPYTKRQKAVMIPQTADFTPPQGFAAHNVPEILDKLNPAGVDTWIIEVDLPDDASGTLSNQVATSSTNSSVHFIR